MLATIIPVKPFAESKTRLASVLSPSQRVELSRMLLTRTVRLATEIGYVVVVSRSTMALAVAARNGARTLLEREPDLNAAVRQGIAWIQHQGFQSCLILPIDLPHLNAEDLKQFIQLGQQKTPSIAIAPCQQEQGTNALLLNPAHLIAPQFGVASFAAHRHAAQTAGIPTRIYRSSSLAFDLDTPDGWQHFITVDHPQPIFQQFVY